jgi:hypothetical protein
LDDSLIAPSAVIGTLSKGGGVGTPTAVPDLSHFDQTTPYADKRIYKKNIDPDEISTTSGVEYNTRRASTRENSPAGRRDTSTVTRKKSEIELADDSEDIIGEEIPLVPMPLSLILHPSDSQVSHHLLYPSDLSLSLLR